jgi:GNAT superfamily N-acetyltransferase
MGGRVVLAMGAPEPLAGHHALDGFDSSAPTFDDWLKHRAASHQASGGSRTYVVCSQGHVVGYYSLATKTVAAIRTGFGRPRGDSCDPVLAIMLGRLAVARSHQGRGVGRALFQDAVRRVVCAGGAIGIRALLVRFLSEGARAFYLRLGLDSSPLDAMTLMATLEDLRAALRSDRPLGD